MPAPALSSSVRGIAYMLGAVIMLPVMDALSKSLTTEYEPVQISAVRFGCLLVFLGPLTVLRNGRKALNPPTRTLLFLRGALLSVSSVLYVSALAHIPLATTQSIALVSPLLVTALSPWLLGEHVGPIRWSAIALGCLGALVIIRPGLQEVTTGQLLALASAGAYAAYVLMTRKMARTGGASRLEQLLWTVIGALVLTGALAPFWWKTPDLAALAVMALCGILSGIAHLLIIAAYTEAEATVVVPFTYGQIAIGALIGYTVWGNLPDALSWAGIALIVGAGVVVALRAKTPPPARSGDRP